MVLYELAKETNESNRISVSRLFLSTFSFQRVPLQLGLSAARNFAEHGRVETDSGGAACKPFASAQALQQRNVFRFDLLDRQRLSKRAKRTNGLVG